VAAVHLAVRNVAEERQKQARPQAPDDERRKKPRAPSTRGDWESITLRRVARRVESLPAGEDAARPGPSAEEPRAPFGWEETVLRNLRQRLKDRGSS
jgi:hypothetical protein